MADSLPDDLGWLRDLLRPWLAALISLSLLLAANAVVSGSGRIIYSLARHAQLPAALGRVAAARGTPYAGITLLGVCAAALLLPADPLLLFGLFGFGAALAFTLANASVVALRYREPALVAALRFAAQRPLPRRCSFPCPHSSAPRPPRSSGSS